MFWGNTEGAGRSHQGNSGKRVGRGKSGGEKKKEVGGSASESDQQPIGRLHLIQIGTARKLLSREGKINCTST